MLTKPTIARGPFGLSLGAFTLIVILLLSGLSTGCDDWYSPGPDRTLHGTGPQSNGASRMLDWFPSGDRLVFTFDQRIFTVGADGRNVRGITEARPEVEYAYASSPAVAPDGSRIFFNRFSNGGSDFGWITVSSLPDGSSAEPLIEADGIPLYGINPLPSPDGQKVMIQAGKGLYIMGPDREVKPVTKPSPEFTHKNGTWSTNGRHVSFLFPRETPEGFVRDLHVASVETGRQTRIEENVTGVPAWSPDSQRVAYVFLGSEEKPSGVYSSGLDGGDPQPLWIPDKPFTNYTGLAASQVSHWLEWSHDGTKLLITDQDGFLGIIDLEKPNQVHWTSFEQTENTDLILQATWAPDDSRISVYVDTVNDISSGRLSPAVLNNNAILFTVKPDLSDSRTLARFQPVTNEPDWGYKSPRDYYLWGQLVAANGELGPATAETTVASRLPESEDETKPVAAPADWYPYTTGENSPRYTTPENAETPATTAVTAPPASNEPAGSPLPAPEPCIEDNASNCSERDISDVNPVGGGVLGAAAGPTFFPTVEELMEKGLFLLEDSPSHLAIRGSVPDNSIRCGWYGLTRSASQREKALRFWLSLEEGDPIPSGERLKDSLYELMEDSLPQYRNEQIAFFDIMISGDESTDQLDLGCYATVAVDEYILGSGPTTLEVAYFTAVRLYSYDLYRRSHESGMYGAPQETLLMSPGEYGEYLESVVTGWEENMTAMLGGRETVLLLTTFTGLPGVAVEAWQAVEQWDLQSSETTNDQGETVTQVTAVRYGVPTDHEEHSQPLAELKQQITTAAAGDAFAGNRIASATGIMEHYRQLGAYGDITPNDGSTETFTPAQPPPAYACVGAHGHQ